MSFFNGNKTTKIDRDEKITCTKILEFDAGHRVFNADTEKCEKLHGHRYKVELTFEADKLDNGMVIDFCLIKDKVKKWLDMHWDHNVILSKRDSKLAVAIEEITDQQVFLIDNNATTELMAEYLLQICNDELFVDLPNNVRCVKVKLWETPTSFAKVKIKENKTGFFG